jgi:hypothetical protein
MGFKCGIVGLPNAGKSTIFNSLTSNKVNVDSYPFTTIDPNVGIVRVPDKRLERLGEVLKPKKIIPTTLKFVDIAGLVKGASKGEGLGNQFLSQIREVDAIIHVVRGFEDESIAHIYDNIDPKRDIEIVNLELVMADLEIVEKRIEKIGRLMKVGEKGDKALFDLYNKLISILSEGKPLRDAKLDNKEILLLKDLQLLTLKPVLYVINVDENGLDKNNKYVKMIENIAKEENTKFIVICGKIESELVDFDESEREEILREFGIEESGLTKLIREGYKLLNLITFYTVVSSELRGWTVLRGTKAPQAGAIIHSDFERGFIAVEVILYDDFIEVGSESKAREKGIVRVEGQNYVVRDGDILHFRFNV